MFLVRAVGSVTGAVVSGVLMDWLPRFSYTLLSFIVTGGMASMFMQKLYVASAYGILNGTAFV